MIKKRKTSSSKTKKLKLSKETIKNLDGKNKVRNVKGGRLAADSVYATPWCAPPDSQKATPWCAPPDSQKATPWCARRM
jgi:hypothetical protein